MDTPECGQSSVRYASFLFVKVSEKFRHLQTNERIAAKQELENTVAGVQEKVFLRTYSLSGLRVKCDILLWMMAKDVREIQTAWAAVSKSGAGKYFEPALAFLGLYNLEGQADCGKTDGAGIPCDLFGKYRYMLLHPLVRSHGWYALSPKERQAYSADRAAVLAKYPSVLERFFYSYGLDDQEFIVVRESDSLEDLALASKELREQKIKVFTLRDVPNMLCVGTDLRYILDSLG